MSEPKTSELTPDLWLASRIPSTIISNTLTYAKWEQPIAECLKDHFQAAMIPPATSGSMQYG